MQRFVFSFLLLLVFLITLTSAKTLNQRFEADVKKDQLKKSIKKSIEGNTAHFAKNSKRSQKRKRLTAMKGSKDSKIAAEYAIKAAHTVHNVKINQNPKNNENTRKLQNKGGKLRTGETFGKGKHIDIEAAQKNAVTFHPTVTGFMSPQFQQMIGGQFENGFDTTISPAYRRELIANTLQIKNNP